MALTPEVDSDLEALPSAAHELAKVSDWSVFWSQRVDSSLSGYDYGEAVRAATGWTPRPMNSEPSNGTQVMRFRLPDGSAVSASQDSVGISTPRLWHVRLDRSDLTPTDLQEARVVAREKYQNRVDVLETAFGRPTRGPVAVREGELPRPLDPGYNSVVTHWHRPGAVLQFSMIERSDFADDPIDHLIHLTIYPEPVADRG